MRVIKPTSDDQLILNDNAITIFLAGSIEMGVAEDWQTIMVSELSVMDEDDIILYNPRRDSWDSSWEQRESNPEFNYQVNWEMDHLEKCDFIFLNLLPETKSPISLLELGKFADSDKMIVCCPEGFWRKGNVEVVCSRYGIPLFGSFRDAIGCLYTKISQIRKERF